MILRTLVKIIAIIMLASVPSLAQTATELQNKYGPADSQRYKIRPGISMTVSFTKEGKAAEMVIKPDQEQPKDLLALPKIIPTTVATEIIDELVPSQQRGEVITGMDVSSGVTSVQSTGYEHVTIIRKTTKILQDDEVVSGDMEVVIQWK